MRIEDFKKLLEDMTEEELLDLNVDVRRNRQTITQERVAAVRKKTSTKNAKTAVKSLSYEDKVALAKALGLPIPSPPLAVKEDGNQQEIEEGL